MDENGYKCLQEGINGLRLSKERKTNLLQRLWAITSYDEEALVRVKSLKLPTLEIDEVFQNDKQVRFDISQQKNSIGDLKKIHHRELSSALWDENPNEIFSLGYTEIDVVPVESSHSKSEKNEHIALYRYPKFYTISSSEPTSGYIFPLALNYLPQPDRKGMFCDCDDSFSVFYRKNDDQYEKFFLLKHDFLFEFNNKIEAMEGSQPVGVLSLFSLKSFTYHMNNMRLELEFVPKYIDYEEPQPIEDNDDEVSVGSGNKGFTKYRQPYLKHFATSYGDDIYKMANRELHSRRITLVHKNGGNDLEKLVKHIQIFKKVDKKFLGNSYDFEKVPIGRGKFSVVFKALNLETEKPCALKVIKKEEFWQFVEQESEKSDTLSREIAINLFLSTKENSSLYFVMFQSLVESEKLIIFEMELMQSADLFQYLSQHKTLNKHQVQAITTQLVKAIIFLRLHKIAHRDIKLSNIVLAEKGLEPRIIDFGLAMFEDNKGKVYGRCGTPGFIAPEILNTKANSGYYNNVDIFSLGVVIYILLVGYEPFPGENERELVISNKNCDVRYDPLFWNETLVDPQAKLFVKQLLQAQPSARPSPTSLLNHPWLKRKIPKSSSMKKKTENKMCVIV